MILINRNCPEKLKNHLESGIFRPIDINLAEYYYEKSTVKSDEIYLSILLVSRALCEGSICFDFNIAEIPGDTSTDFSGFFSDIAVFEKKMLQSGIVGLPGDFHPLIYDNGKLYFQKYFRYEETLAEIIKTFAGKKPVINIDILKTSINILFPSDPAKTDNQKIAAFNSCMNYLSIISGGPGTGKTTTVVKVVLLLIEQMIDRNEVPDIAFTAPTGKAAAHLLASVNSAVDSILAVHPGMKGLVGFIPEQSHTIHRLLGPKWNSPFFRHNKDNKLSNNIIVVDETSMTDIALMYKFLTAVNEGTHLIFLGDKDQLASVQPGSVLGDICGFPAQSVSEKIISEYAQALDERPDTETSPDCGSIHQNIFFLTKSHRFSDSSGIGRFASLIRNRKSNEIRKLISIEKEKNVTFSQIFTESDRKLFEKKNSEILENFILGKDILKGYAEYTESKSIEEAFENFRKFRVLCALRKGFFGSENINRYIEKILSENRLLHTKRNFYHLKPVIIMSNDYSLNLYNGDIGIIFEEQNTSGVKVYFENNIAIKPDFKRYSPLQLKNFETVFAMTVHKSQGSEYDDILLVLPKDDSPLLTSELIYTGLTRAKKHAAVFGDMEVFLNSTGRRLKRMSGLNSKIYSDLSI